ncbi:MAG: hypothetical protein CM15mP49_08390 [Actinomycetota bacterium]|nr:MAG: hypothetical protein CM15mP49_08390 [Actinomycetota bacterium]
MLNSDYCFPQTHPDALHRTCLDGHLTGSAAIVDHTGERILIMLHKSCKFGFSLEAMRMAMEIYLG